MRTVVLPATEVAVSRLSFGTASLHHIFAGSRRAMVLQTAIEMGFTHLDTSPYYGFGIAEETIGRLPERLRSKISIATKIGLYPPIYASGSVLGVAARKAVGKWIPALSRAVVDASVSRAELSFHASLKRMRRDHVEFLFLHEPEAGTFSADEWLRWFEFQHASGRVGHFGLAGNAGPMQEWISAAHPVAWVLQVRDSMDRREADAVTGCGRSLQFTYGYIVAAHSRPERPVNVSALIKAALERNATGSVLVSARNSEHIRQLAALAG